MTITLMAEGNNYCGDYCEHNAHGQCGCPPCQWIRANTGFKHQHGCPYADAEE